MIGREFAVSVLRKTVPDSEEDLKQALRYLQTGEFVYEQPALPENRYVFKHALTQDVAYGSLLTERRAELHERTARAIEDLHTSHIEDHYSELAHHYCHSSNTGKGGRVLEFRRPASGPAIRQYGGNTIFDPRGRSRPDLAGQ